jgi:hypothetical protein
MTLVVIGVKIIPRLASGNAIADDDTPRGIKKTPAHETHPTRDELVATATGAFLNAKLRTLLSVARAWLSAPPLK